MRWLLALVALVCTFACTPAFAQAKAVQTVTLSAPLVDSNRDGKVTVSAQAKALGVPARSVLTLCAGTAYTYAVNGAPCPVIPTTTKRPVLASPAPEASFVTVAAPKKNGALKLADAAKGRYRVTGPAFRVIETYKDGVYKDLIIDGLDADTTRDGIRLQGKVERVTIRNVTIRHAATPNVSPDLPECVAIRNGIDVRLEHIRCDGFYMTDKAGGSPNFAYPRNGDIVAIESGVGPVYIDDLVGIGASDSLLDFLKGHGLTVGRAYGRQVARCLKSGAVNVHIAVLDCGDTRASGIEVKGNDAVVDLFRYDFNGMTRPITVFSAEKGTTKSASLTVPACEFTGKAPVGTKLKVAGPGTSINLGPSCTLPK